MLLSKTGQTLAVVVNVPVGLGSSVPGPCARIGTVDIGWFDGTVVPALLLKMAALKPTAFPIFLAYNVFFYEGSPANCCMLSYHSEIVNTKGIQTYAYASFNGPGIFGSAPLQDIDGLSHEVGERMDDPWMIR